ncbi:MAG TPA: hypothetical protein VM686_12070 [Polyangiaceae bacterium]|nr:hypothetical protein [Polyangiaceae bacterium]
MTKGLVAVLSLLVFCCEEKIAEPVRLDVRQIVRGATKVALDDMRREKLSCEEWATTKQPPLDSWRSPYRYTCTATEVCVSSDGNDRIPGTPDDIAHCAALREDAP